MVPQWQRLYECVMRHNAVLKGDAIVVFQGQRVE